MQSFLMKTESENKFQIKLRKKVKKNKKTSTLIFCSFLKSFYSFRLLFFTFILCLLLFVIKIKEALFKQGAKTTQKNTTTFQNLLCHWNNNFEKLNSRKCFLIRIIRSVWQLDVSG